MFNFKIMRAMNVFLLKTVCFLLGLWFVSFLLANAADRIAPMNVYGHQEADKLRVLQEKKDTVQAISLGNSHSGAIDFATMGLEGQVLARAGTDLFEVKLYADSVAPALPKLEQVFIAISYFSFTNNNVLSEDTRNLRIELYGMLPTWNRFPGDTDSFILGKINRYFDIMNIVRPDNWEQVFKNALEGEIVTEYQPEYQVKTTTRWGDCAHFTEKEIEEIGYEIGYKAANRSLLFLDIDPNSPVQSQQALADTIQMLQARGTRVILFTPPYHISYNNRFSETAPQVIQTMQQTIENLQEMYSVEYYNASTMAEFSTHPELFINSDHLNQCGTRAFSEYLQKVMAKRKRNDSH